LAGDYENAKLSLKCRNLSGLKFVDQPVHEISCGQRRT